SIDPKRPELGPDEAVVARVLGGERALYEVLVRRHNQRLYRAARAILRSEARFSTWLTRIAVHEALARRRRAQRQTPMEESKAESPTPAASPEEHAGSREIAHILEGAIDALPDTFREV